MVYNVLQIVDTFESISGSTVSNRFTLCRPDVIATSFANPSKATRHLVWSAMRDLYTVMPGVWLLQMTNPDSYKKSA
jgi:UDP-glucose 4-epimerase